MLFVRDADGEVFLYSSISLEVVNQKICLHLIAS